MGKRIRINGKLYEASSPYYGEGNYGAWKITFDGTTDSYFSVTLTKGHQFQVDIESDNPSSYFDLGVTALIRGSKHTILDIGDTVVKNQVDIDKILDIVDDCIFSVRHWISSLNGPELINTLMNTNTNKEVRKIFMDGLKDMRRW